MQSDLSIRPVGHIRRKDDLTAILEIDGLFQDATLGLSSDDRLDVSYWMHELPSAERNTQQVHPRGDQSKPLRGVFGVRSPMRPNPIGVTTVSVESIDGLKITVRGLDAFDGAPIVDIKAAREPQGLGEVIAAWGRVHEAMVRSLFSILSEGECADLLRKPMQHMGAEAAGTIERPLTPGEIGRRIMDFEAHWGIQGCILEETADCFVREVAVCPWSHFHPTSCRILAWYIEGFVKALNPDCIYKLDELIPAGDATCCWSVQI